jgi:hypothetical protein
MFVQAPVPAAPGVPFGFQKGVLGETLADWLRTAAGAAACSPRPGASRIVVCGVAPIPIGGEHMARDVAFTFVDGRLARIRFRTSIDAYDRVRARLDSRYGPPRPVIYDEARIEHSIETPHVRAVWRSGRSTIVVDDPDQDGTTLSVTYTLDSLAPALRGTST